MLDFCLFFARSLPTDLYAKIKSGYKLLAVCAVVFLGLRTLALSVVLTDPPVTVGTAFETLVEYLSTTAVGTVVVIRLAAGAALVVASRRIDSTLVIGALLAIFVALRGLEGHAMAREGLVFALHAISAMLHQIAVAGWIGLLPPLLFMLRSKGVEPQIKQEVVQKTGQLAAFFVAVIVLTGTGLTSLMLGSFAAILEEDYGHRLTDKLQVFVVILGVAAINRWILTPRIAGSPAARRNLGIALCVEIGLCCLTIVLALMLSSTHPPID